MLVKFFGGTGSGGGIAGYLVDPERQGREEAPPEVLSGDIDRTHELIDSIDRKWTYSTGVISFSLEDKPTAAQQKALMADFERVAFAGLPRDRYDITWVRHSHTDGGRVELHFLTPRMDLATGKSFNIAPPGWDRSYAPLRDAYNYTYGWARPDDPARARTQQRVAETAPRLEGREAITAFLEQKIIAGDVANRASLVAALHEAGFQTPREGKSYVTALDPDSGERWRLKGRIYEKDWTRNAELDRAATRQGAATADRADGIDAERAAAAHERLEAVIARRAEWVGERYPDPAERASAERQIAEDSDQDRSERDPRETEAVDRDERRDSSTDRDTDLGRSDAVDEVAARQRDSGNQCGRDVPDPADNGGTGVALWRAALRKIGGLNDREIDGDRASAFGRIRELGSRVRDIGANAFSTIRAFFSADKDVERPTEQARDALAASERSLGKTEQTNDRLDREGTSLERRIEMTEQIAELERGFERQRQLTR